MARWITPHGLVEAHHRKLQAQERKRLEEVRLQEVGDSGRKALSRNADLKGALDGRRCFILGNGPSLNELDLTRIFGEVTFVVNLFHRSPLLDRWSPTYWVGVDPKIKEIASDPWVQEFVSGVSERVRAKSYFVPVQARQALEESGVFAGKDLRYLYQRGDVDPTVEGFELDLTRPLPSCQTTPVMCIQLAMYMGASEIYLIGMDHDWLKYGQEGYRHFFPPQPGDTGVGDWPYDKLASAVVRMWEGYRRQRTYAERHGIRIYNATKGGFLDVFERVDYDSLFS
ncbi:MAG: hypothetical protein OEY97_00300 [Nitrospirota bacterium]|nr:hypothetical protein [Nitrospirota bacterium]